MAKVLVTGASGFIGSHLVPVLAGRGDEVTCFVRKTSQVELLCKAGATLVYGDVTDAESVRTAVAGQQVVYHVAGCTQAISTRDYYAVNEHGMANVARACAAQTTSPVLIAVSSLAAAGPAVDGRPRTEADRPRPVSNYGCSKLAGERATAAFAGRVPITIVRPPIVLGERDPVSLMLFRSIARLGIHMVPGWRQRRYSVIHADDLVALLVLAAERGKRLSAVGEESVPPGQGYYFVASQVDPSYADMGRMVAKALGCQVRVVCSPIPLVWTIALGGEAIARIRGKPVYMNLDKTHEIAAGDWTCSSWRATEELGFQTQTPLEDRLSQTAEWYRAANWL